MVSKLFSKWRLTRLFVFIKNNPKKSVLSVLAALVFTVGIYQSACWVSDTSSYVWHAWILDDQYDHYYRSCRLNDHYSYRMNGKHGYVVDNKTGRKVLRDIDWMVGIGSDDSLLCFASHGYRGFFNRRTGKADIAADRYVKAWEFSEGLAAVMGADSLLKFINPHGEVVIDKQFRFAELPGDGRGYCFHHGYCLARGLNGRWGLIDHDGRWSLPPGYDNIVHTATDEEPVRHFWKVVIDGRIGLLNDSLVTLLEPDYRQIIVKDYGLEVLRENYVRQLLDFDGRMVQPFLYTDIMDLKYKTKITTDENDMESAEWTLSPYKVYQTTYTDKQVSRVGLLGPDARPVTLPIYCNIEAVSPGIFRCYYDESGGHYFSECLSVLINSKGKVIKVTE